MRFLVPIAEFDFDTSNQELVKNGKLSINSNTSVNEVKAHFFETLAKLGEIIKINADYNLSELSDLCQMNDVIFACFHETPPENIACRLLYHTKGALMLSGGFLDRWTFMDTTMNIVTSQKQSSQLKESLGNVAPLLGAFVSKMNTDDFRLPSKDEQEKARVRYKIKDDTFHIVFGGRFISNKGIAQLVRALNIWPEKNIHITLVGNFEPDFFIYQSNAAHATFISFFEREIIGQNKNGELVCLPSMNHQDLCELFWSADCFGFPSFHEDEAIGTTPRLAMLCGVPVVATDFCGFSQLANTKSGMIKTYPTLGGVRYSLNQLAEEISTIINWNDYEKNANIKFNAEVVLDFCNTEKSELELKTAVEQLLKIPVCEAPTGGWRSKERFDKWIKKAPNAFQEAVALAKTPFPDGLYTDGTGDIGLGWFSEPHFLKAIQGIYTTYPVAPKAITGSTYRGFWRIAIWKEEKAVVEFGFPGPRIKRYSSAEWDLLMQCIKLGDNGEPVFYPDNLKALELVDELILLGYLVPDKF